jgi:hypothetical protein
MMNPPIPTLASVRTRRRVERFNACAGLPPGLGVGVPAGTVGEGVPSGIVAVGVGDGVGVPAGTVAVAVEVGVNVGVGVPPPHVPNTLNTMCMFGNPIVDTSVGVVMLHDTALM